MRLKIIKIVLFFVITTIALIDYRMLTIKDGKLLVANWHQVSSWAEIESSLERIEGIEVYPSRVVRRSRVDDEHYVVIYMDQNFYNIKANDIELDRINSLVSQKAIEVVEVEPVDAWFYGLLVVLLIVFPVMRKEEKYL
jgi:hypothetical protein